MAGNLHTLGRIYLEQESFPYVAPSVFVEVIQEWPSEHHWRQQQCSLFHVGTALRNNQHPDNATSDVVTDPPAVWRKLVSSLVQLLVSFPESEGGQAESSSWLKEEPVCLASVWLRSKDSTQATSGASKMTEATRRVHGQHPAAGGSLLWVSTGSIPP